MSDRPSFLLLLGATLCLALIILIRITTWKHEKLPAQQIVEQQPEQQEELPKNDPQIPPKNASSTFRGPTEAPNIIGPSGPPPNY